MNILLIIVAAVFLLNVILGYSKGFLKTVFSLISWILVLMICQFATPVVTDYLMEKTEITGIVEEGIHNTFVKLIENAEIGELDKTIPEELRIAVLGEGNTFEEMILTSGMEAIDVSPIVRSILSIFSFIAVLATTKILMIIIEKILDMASKLPLIGTLDKSLGLILGAGKGLLIVWIILAIISMLALTETNTEWIAYITESKLLTWLQEHNFILKLLI